MIMVLAIGLLGGLALLGMSLQKTYHHVSAKELKRRAREGDAIASALYPAVAYGISLRIILWVVITVSSAAFFMLLARTVSSNWVALLVALIFIWVNFVWLPMARVTKPGIYSAKRVTPILAGLLRYIYPLLDRFGGFIRRHRPISIHTGLYNKDDLLNLINQQYVQADNRVTEEELQMAAHALTFGDKLVRDFMTPRRVVKMISADDSIGPVLLGELHDSGFSRFPVQGGNPDEIVGTLHLRDLLDLAEGGKVSTVMKKVLYIHEEQSLHDALQAMLKTNHHLFMVVNSFEEFVGIITIEDVLEQIIGKQIVDEFDQYDEMRAVAKLAANKDLQQRHDS